MDLLWLGETGAHDATLVGGKAAHLSQLAAEYRVPIGFCLSTAAFEYASHASLQLPSALSHALEAAYHTLADHLNHDQPSVAVRSSAADEDGSNDSFAGQHETYLNVRGISAVVDAVQRCWASARAERVLEYRCQRGLSTERIRLAVLVQHLIVADSSAVVFSTNPVTGNPNEIVINANWGLGESIVGGLVTPDTYIIRKSDGQIVSRQVAEKRHMTIAVSGGTREVEIPRYLRARAVLADAQVQMVAQLAMSLEKRMGWPVDVECAYHADHLYLLQCRPITTAMPVMSAPHYVPAVELPASLVTIDQQ